jgi:N-acetylmuramic acid 6-phosphate (MurNAc-6-P) etherase
VADAALYAYEDTEEGSEETLAEAELNEADVVGGIRGSLTRSPYIMASLHSLERLRSNLHVLILDYPVKCISFVSYACYSLEVSLILKS